MARGKVTTLGTHAKKSFVTSRSYGDSGGLGRCSERLDVGIGDGRATMTGLSGRSVNPARRIPIFRLSWRIPLTIAEYY